ncbi:MAG: hypothetical protein RIS64_2524 [Bacteroidota bacterium]|jgi:hypothetical protein
MMFDFQAYIATLREQPEKKGIVEKYEKHFGAIEGDIKDQYWYKSYLFNFDYVSYAVPTYLQDEFDWEALLKLVAGSFSTRSMLKFEATVPTFNIEVHSNESSIDKNIGELMSFQLIRLFEIYIEEAMNLQTFIETDEMERAAITRYRTIKINEWNLHLITSRTEQSLNQLFD